MMERARWRSHGEMAVTLGRHEFWTRQRFPTTLGKGIRGKWTGGRTYRVIRAVRAATFRVRAEGVIGWILSLEAGAGQLEGTYIAGGGRPGAETRAGSGV